MPAQLFYLIQPIITCVVFNERDKPCVGFFDFEKQVDLFAPLLMGIVSHAIY